MVVGDHDDGEEETVDKGRSPCLGQFTESHVDMIRFSVAPMIN